MGHHELIKALQQKGEQSARELWREAEAEAARVRDEADRKIEAISAEASQQHTLADEERIRSTLGEADRQALRITAEARSDLASRLYDLAREDLSRFRQVGYDALFHALAEELPQGAWEEVRVHPEDESLARENFPQARVVTDAAIVGGLLAVGKGGRLQVDNTLEGRLERAWPGLLPGLLEEITDLLR